MTPLFPIRLTAIAMILAAAPLHTLASAQDATPAPAATEAVATEVIAQTPDPLAKGKYLATVGNCVSCHTREDGQPFAGGVAFKTDFGTIYSTNITPDTTVGIGGWTEAQFMRAMREGIAEDGEHLYPAFPYTAFTKVTDEDLKEIFSYLKSVPASSTKPTPNQMGFPFNQRQLMAVWNTMFFEAGVYKADPKQSPEWNRGAYLVEGLGHCGACHTPRNILGGEKNDQALSGGIYQDKVAGGAIRQWSAVNLTSAGSGLKAWTPDDIAAYLKTGHGNRAGSFGPMNEVIINSTQHMTDEDTKAIATYLKGLAPLERSTAQKLSDKDLRAGETLYTIHCGTCHLPTGLGSTPGSELGPPLAGSAVVQAPDPASLINVILYGAEIPTPPPPKAWKSMKAFGVELDDDQVAMLANYLRASWGNLGGPVTAAQVTKQR